ncbi:MAG: DUF1345 domain-containing protein [Formivibrio sp.]|nr:DUF1345 domain-containing protein [Formivibrio sp.]
MGFTYTPLIKFWHQVRARPRLIASCAIGVLAFGILPLQFAPSTRVLVAWDIGAGLYLALAWIMIRRQTVEHMRWRARVEDDGAKVVLILTVAAAIASLAAIVLELSGQKTNSHDWQSLHLALAAVTLAISWLLVHTTFSLHYAHTYYIALGQKGGAPLDFPKQDTPVCMDFLYFAMVIGMTSQTADVAITSTQMRRLVMAHGIIAFVFNTTLLALTINIAASLLG